MIYEMLTGELPIGRFLPPSAKSEFDKRLDEAVMRALEKEPIRRYQQASELKTGFTTATLNATAAFSALKTPVAPIKKFFKSENRPRISFSIMGGRERKGRWKVGKPQFAITLMGATVLDLTQVTDSDISLNLFTLMGGTEVIVPRDANIDAEGFMLIGAYEENIAEPTETPKKNIRIRSIGAMGGCEIRSENPTVPLAKPTKFNQYRLPPEHEINLSNGLVFAYKALATIVGLTALVFFALEAFDLMRDSDSKMVAWILGISCLMFWSGLGYFRRLIGAGPEKHDDESIKKYYSSTIPGTLIRSLALMIGFACPILLVVSRFERHDAEEIQMAAVACAVTSIVFFSAATYVEEFLYGKLKK